MQEKFILPVFFSFSYDKNLELKGSNSFKKGHFWLCTTQKYLTITLFSEKGHFLSIITKCSIRLPDADFFWIITWYHCYKVAHYIILYPAHCKVASAVKTWRGCLKRQVSARSYCLHFPLQPCGGGQYCRSYWPYEN